MKLGGEPSPAAQFEALCLLLWDGAEGGWQRCAAEFLGINLRNVQFYAAEPPARSKAAPAGVLAELREEVRKRWESGADRARMESVIERLGDRLAAMRTATQDVS